jgi:hypothetical protein
MRMNINNSLEEKFQEISFNPYRSQINPYPSQISTTVHITSIHSISPSGPSIMENPSHSPPKVSNANINSPPFDQSYGGLDAVENAALVNGNNTRVVFHKAISDNMKLVIPQGTALQNVCRPALFSLSFFSIQLSQADSKIQSSMCSSSIKLIITSSNSTEINTMINLVKLPHPVCIIVSTQQPTDIGNSRLSPRTTSPADMKTHLLAAISTISSSYPASSPVQAYIDTLGVQIKSLDMQSTSSTAWFDFLQAKIAELSGQKYTLFDKYAAELKAKVDAVPAEDRSSVAEYLELLKDAIGSHGAGATEPDVKISAEEEEERKLTEVVEAEENYDAALSTYVKVVNVAVAELDKHIKEFETTSGTIYTGPAAANTTALKKYVSSLDSEIQNNKVKIYLEESEPTSTTNHTLLNSFLLSLEDAINDRIAAAHEDDAMKQSDAEKKLSQYHHAFLHTVQLAREEFERNITASTSTSSEHSKRTLLSFDSQQQAPTMPSTVDANTNSELNLVPTNDGSFTTMRLEASSKFRLTKHRNGTDIIETVRKTPGSYSSWEGVLNKAAQTKPNDNAHQKRELLEEEMPIPENVDVDAGAGTDSLKLIYLPQNASSLPPEFWRSNPARVRPGKTLPSFNRTRFRSHRRPLFQMPENQNVTLPTKYRPNFRCEDEVDSTDTATLNLTYPPTFGRKNRIHKYRPGCELRKWRQYLKDGNWTSGHVSTKDLRKALEKGRVEWEKADEEMSSRAVPRSESKEQEKGEIGVTEPANQYHRIFSRSDVARFESESGLSSRDYLKQGAKNATADLPIVLAVRSPEETEEIEYPPSWSAPTNWFDFFYMIDEAIASLGGYRREFHSRNYTTGERLVDRDVQEYDFMDAPPLSMLLESQPRNVTIWMNNTAVAQQDGNTTSKPSGSSTLCSSGCDSSTSYDDSGLALFGIVMGGLFGVAILMASCCAALEECVKWAKKRKDREERDLEEGEVQEGEGKVQEEEEKRPEEKVKDIDEETLVEGKIGGGSA